MSAGFTTLISMPRPENAILTDPTAVDDRTISQQRNSFARVQIGENAFEGFYGVTNGAASSWEISTTLKQVRGGVILKSNDTLVTPYTIKPKSTDPSIAVITGLAISTTYLFSIIGD